MKFSKLKLASALLALYVSAPVNAAPEVRAADYARAEKVLDSNLSGAVLNARIEAHWIDNDRFWYRRDSADGAEHVLVDAAKATRSVLFDQKRLSGAMRKIVANATASEPLKIDAIRINGGKWTADVRAKSGELASCRLDTYRCVGRTVATPPTDALLAPDGTLEVFSRDHNLWVRERDGSQEWPLTRDGEAYFSYGKLPDASLATVPHLRSGKSIPPVGITWSPDGRYLLGSRTDEREVAPYPFIEWVPQDGSFRPITYNLRLPLLGDAGQPRPEAFVIDVARRSKRVLDLGDNGRLGGEATLAWSSDGDKAYRLAYDYGNTRMSLAEIELRTGTVRRVIDETTTTSITPNNLYYSASNMRVLTESSEAIWFSEKSGWGHLYLYDLASGELKRALTQGEWLVRDLVHIDTARRLAWFTATGRESGRDLYHRHLYRVSLDGGEPVLLTPEDAEHEIESTLSSVMAPFGNLSAFSPDGRYVIDSYSTVSTPPVTVLRASDDGRVVMKLEDADISAVKAAGWRAPERVNAKAADGDTDLYAVVYFPPKFNSEQRFPVIDAFYGGPQMMNAPRSYSEAISTMNPISRASLAELGFIVVTIDGRGTRGRSKAFAEVGYGNFADPQIEDHIAVIQQLAQRYGGFDLDRVGVYGHSFGGYTSARAILSHPEFYKVAVSSAGPHNYQGFYDGLDALVGSPDYGDGNRVRPTPQSVPEKFKHMDNATLAANLRGHLMLVYGDMDENALPAVTLQLADALIEANKSFDLLHLPNRTHNFFRTDRYYTRRMWDYFVTHLLGAKPPENYDLSRAQKP